MDTPNDTNDATDTSDDFDAAFAAASGEEYQAPVDTQNPDDQEEGAADDQKPDDQEEGAADDQNPDDQEEGAADDQKPDGQEEGAADGQKPEPAELPAQQQLDPKFLAQAIAEAQAEAERRRTEEQQQDAPQLKADDLLSDADKASIDKFKAEWPDEYAAIDRMTDARVQAAVGNALSAYTKQLNTVLAPLMNSVQSVEVNSHRNAILAVHPDLDQVAPEVVKWVDTQPAVYQPALRSALEKGSAAQVVEVLNLYKAAKGQTGAAPASPASSAAQEQQKPRKVPDPKVVSALAAVPAAQRPRQQGADKNDFDGAFEEAAQALANS
jgi:hypothetical protein